MSFDDSKCICGDRKEPGVMLCSACLDALKDRREMAIFKSDDPVETRRHAAIVLLTLARGRKRRMP